MRIIGLDVGKRRIGIARSDPMGWTAQPQGAYECVSLQKDAAQCAELIRQLEGTRVVIGLPLNMDGSEGEQAQYSRLFADALAALGDFQIELWDERLSTAAARRILIEADVGRKKRKGVIDAMAAAQILQSYLDAHQKPDIV